MAQRRPPLPHFDEPGFDLRRAHSFGYLLRDTSRLLLRALGDDIERHGITLGQYFILRELWENDGMTLGELAAQVGILAPSANAFVDALEKRGVVARTRGAADKRTVHVRLTEQGHTLRNVLLRCAAEVNARALAGVSPHQIDVVRKVLRRAKDNLEREREHDAPPAISKVASKGRPRAARKASS